MSNNASPSDAGDGDKPQPVPHQVDEIYEATANLPPRDPDPRPLIGGLPNYEEATTARPASQAVRRGSDESRRIQAGSYGSHPSELPNSGNIDAMTGILVDYGTNLDRSLDRAYNRSRDMLTASPHTSQQRRLVIPRISILGLDSPYAVRSLMESELPNAPDVDAMTGLYQRAYELPSGPSAPRLADLERARAAAREALNVDCEDGDLPPTTTESSIDESNDSSSMTTSSLTASLRSTASKAGSKISDGFENLVAKATRIMEKKKHQEGQRGKGKKRRNRSEQKEECDQNEEGEKDDDEGNGGTSTLKVTEPQYHRRDDHDHPDSSAPMLKQRGGSCAEFLHTLGFDPLSLNSSTHVGASNGQPLFFQPFRHDGSDSTNLQIATMLHSQLPTMSPDTASIISPSQPNSATLVTNFLPHVMDINSGVLLHQKISPGKLVTVRYKYAAKAADEFDLELGDLFVVLVITADGWALGSTYGDALDYISTREEFCRWNTLEIPNHWAEEGQFFHPRIDVVAKIFIGCHYMMPQRRKPKSRTPVMKFFPLKAVQLVQCYEWTFRPYTPSFNTLKLRSSVITGTKCGTELHDPPIRVISKKPDLMHGQNRKIITLGYKRFVAEVLQKIIEETKYSRQGGEEELLPQTNASVPFPSPASCDETSTNCPTSAGSYTTASSPDSETSWPQSSSVGVSAIDVSPNSIDQAGRPSPLFPSPAHSAVESTRRPTPAEFQALVENKLSNGKAVDHSISQSPDGLNKKPAKKHILKDSWRWASKRKEKILGTLLKKKLKALITQNGTQEPPQESENDHRARTSNSGINTVEAKEHHIDSPYPYSDIIETMNTQLSPHFSQGGWESASTMRQNICFTNVRVPRPSICGVFPADPLSHSNIPIPRITYPESDGSSPSSTYISGVRTLRDSTTKPGRPKLTINTQCIYYTPAPMEVGHATSSPKDITPGSITASPSSFQTNSSDKSEKIQLRSKINSPTSRSPNDRDFTASIDHTMMQSSDRGRGRAREKQRFDIEYGSLSPTCTKDWAAKGLIAKVRRARASLRGRYSRRSDADAALSPKTEVGGKENVQEGMS